ncbi:mrpl22 [[Candida] subhashii]|uniref:Mrpl22 n=1 Tax=[Candida] subhashii TaxID=561895 RepID=A0A8J5QR56_9ASCO|nr:mrpl22 [[Candida] subhashii]KAG7666013.1 mrpl22 [[Candida] subhashii]
MTFGFQSRAISYTPIARSNIFGGLTSTESPTKKSELPANEQIQDDDGNLDLSKITKETDSDLVEFMAKKSAGAQIKLEDYIHPLKLALYNNVVAEHGFYKNGQTVKHENKYYKLNLTPKEIEILEPSIYLESYRIKSSTKKATQVNRFVRQYDLKTAINQLHFNPKKMSTELEKLLKKGLEQVRELGLDENKVFIQQLWAGDDGQARKRLQFHAKGRVGFLKHRYVHLKCILKTEQTRLRLDWERKQRHLAKKPKTVLNNDPLNFKVRPIYKW